MQVIPIDDVRLICVVGRTICVKEEEENLPTAKLIREKKPELSLLQNKVRKEKSFKKWKLRGFKNIFFLSIKL